MNNLSRTASYRRMTILAGPLARDGHVDTMVAENAGKKGHIRKARHAMECQCLFREKAGNHQRQCSVLRTADPNGALEPFAANNADAIHNA